ncbi:MAG TPA: SDR family oxidoreductase [Fibrobacteria bacterium]|nr:SDR family oxidoreductase [Fibrobacteria bacterium]
MIDPSTVVVTGATSAIGRAIAERFLRDGRPLVLQGHRNVRNLDDLSDRARVVSCDLRDARAVDEFCLSVEGALTVVHAASVVGADLLAELSDERIDEMLSVNVLAWVKLCRALVRPMMRARKGCLVAISSVVARRAERGQSVYAGTKAFQEGFVRALAAEVASRGVRVNAVAPGPVDAGSLRGLLSQAPDEVRASLACGRLGTPDDIAKAVHWICSEDASFVHGQVLSVDGGFQRGVG